MSGEQVEPDSIAALEQPLLAPPQISTPGGAVGMPQGTFEAVSAVRMAGFRYSGLRRVTLSGVDSRLFSSGVPVTLSAAPSNDEKEQFSVFHFLGGRVCHDGNTSG